MTASFQAVAIPAGSHRVEFSYEAPGVLLGFLAGVGCAWLLVPPMGLLAFSP
jgi:hypothetical protein